MKGIALDIFCGSGSFGKVAGTLGYEVISLDNRRRKGTCEPNLKIDILNLPSSFFTSLQPRVMWFGLPCDIWSYASGGFHLDKDFNPKTEKAVQHLEIFNKTIQIIERTLLVKNNQALEKSMLQFYFIENPRGKLRNYPGLKEFLKRTGGVEKTCTLSSYGFPTTKPTNIFTNFTELKLKELDSYGRGAKNKGQVDFDTMTKVQRQKTPELLIRHILRQVDAITD